MGKALENLAKDLAQGVSRRTALKRFFIGVGTAAGALVSGRAFANNAGNSICVQLCREQGLEGREFGQCVSASAHCPEGECAFSLNGNDFVCLPVA